MEMDLGEFDGMDARRWRAEYPAFHECWRLTPGSTKMPGGECLNDVQIRAVNALMRLSEPYEPGSTLLLCGHNFVNITILCFALEIPLDRFRELRQEPTALNILYREGDHLRAESINDTSHLNGLRVHASTIHK